MHADHVTGLPGILMLNSQVDRDEPLYIFGPPKIAEYVEQSRRSLDMYINYEIIVKEINEPGVLRAMFSIIRSNMTLAGLKKELSDALLKKIDQLAVPTLILYGENDRIVPNINSKLLHQSLPVSECISIKNCGHELQFECCDLFCRYAEDFLLS